MHVYFGGEDANFHRLLKSYGVQTRQGVGLWIRICVFGRAGQGGGGSVPERPWGHGILHHPGLCAPNSMPQLPHSIEGPGNNIFCQVSCCPFQQLLGKY